jgi:formylglycine-generating enzyme required for sulfatase activity
MRRLLILAALLVALPAQAVDIEWVYVGDPGNPPDTATNCLPFGTGSPDCGTVPYAYYISKYEVTNAQYVEFLNAVAAADPNGLYKTNLRAEITRSGEDGSYSYAFQSGRENNPVVPADFLPVPSYHALRFANWLHNGQPTGAQDATTTEDGAYTLAKTSFEGRNTGATIFLPTENEWYKAAYYDATSASFFAYPTGSNEAPSSEAPPGGANSANFYDQTTGFALTGSTTYDPVINYLTDVGAYASSNSPYGTFDQGGNIEEWNETMIEYPHWPVLGVRGGNWQTGLLGLAASSRGGCCVFGDKRTYFGFRVAAVPEPAQVLLVLTGGLVLAAARRRTGGHGR